MSANIDMVALAHFAAGIAPAAGSPLPKLVAELARARKAVEVEESAVRMCEMLVEATSEGRMLAKAREDLEAARLAVTFADVEVRQEAEAEFRKDGEKTIMPGVSVKLWTRYAYDARTVANWARENMPSLLVLDTKKLEKAAAAGVLADAPVSVVREPRVQIAADLTSYL